MPAPMLIPSRLARLRRPACFCALTALLLCTALPGQAQRFMGELTDTDDELRPGLHYDMYTLHCVGGEALRLSLYGDGFHGRILIKHAQTELVSSLDSRLTPERGTSIDFIAEHPGDYTVAVTSFDQGAAGRYLLDLEPLTHGRWVTVEQGIGQSENSRFQFGFLAMKSTSRFLAYCAGHRVALGIEAGQAGGTSGPSEPFADGQGVMLPATFEGVGMPRATITLTDGGNGEVYYAYQTLHPQEVVERDRAVSPQAQVPGAFPEGRNQTAFTIQLRQGQPFFAFVAAEGLVQPAAPGQAGQAPGPTPADYRVWVTGPDGQPVDDDAAQPFMAQFQAQAQGEYTVHVARTPDLPDTFNLGYSLGRDVPDLDAPVRWTTGEGRMIVRGTLDDSCERIAGRRFLTYGVVVDRHDVVVIDTWTDGYKPSVIVVTPDGQSHTVNGHEGSDRHAAVRFTAREPGLCTIFIVARTPDDAGDFQASFGVAQPGATQPGADPLKREDPTAGGWTTRQRLVGTLDEDDKRYDNMLYESTFIEVENEDHLRLVLVADGYRADLYLGLPDGTDLESQYDPATNSSIITLPAGIEGDVDVIISAVRPGDAGDYTIEVQQRE